MNRSTPIKTHRPQTPWLPFLVLALASVICLGAAARASAAITATRIDVPQTTTFQFDDQAQPPTLTTVAGATNSTDPAVDAVDIYCVGEAGWQALAQGVPLADDRSFSVGVSTHPLRGLCRLRAFPSGAIPGNEAPFVGPLIAVGGVSRTRVLGGTNDETLTDYFLVNPQLTAGDSYASAGNCGLQAGFLINADRVSTQTFACSDWFWVTTALRGENVGNPRSELQVDGKNAYLPAGAKIINQNAAGLPELTFAYHHDPATGNLTVTESEPLVECSTQAFPPVDCPSFVPSGVRLERTVEQTDDGHLVTITDRYSSSDGNQHQLDLLSQQAARFSATSPPLHPVGYRFPGETDYSVHHVGDVVGFAANAPGTIYARQQETLDGDPAYGRAAIVFDRPASPATFNYEDSYATGFFLHQTGTVPATGSTRFRFAYAQAYSQADVEALVDRTRAAFGGAPAEAAQPPTDGGQPPAPPASPASPAPKGKAKPKRGLVAPSNRIRVAKIRLDRRHGSAKLKLFVPGPGDVSVGGRRLRTVHERVLAAGASVLTVRPKPALAAILRHRGRARVPLKISFTPVGGTPRRQVRQLRLVRRGPA